MPSVHVHVNGAASLDGRTALPDGRPLRLSGPEDHARVHRLRASVDAILVGVGTVLADDPHLTARPGGNLAPRQPLRVVLDSRGRTPPSSRVLDDAAPTLVLTARSDAGSLEGAEVVPCGEDRVDLTQALDLLAKRAVRRLLVEGGGTVVRSFLEGDLVDALTLYVAPRVVGGTGPSLVSGPGVSDPAELQRLELQACERLGEGALLTYGRGSS